MEARKLSQPNSRSFQLSLRVRHPTMDPADLSREFKIEAEHAYRAGDPRPRRSSLIPASVHSESYWLGELDPMKWPPNLSFPDLSFPGPARLQLVAEHLRTTAANSLGWALSLCAARFSRWHAALLHRLRSEGGQISLIVTLDADEVSSFSLSPEVSRVFADLGVTVEFEFSVD